MKGSQPFFSSVENIKGAVFTTFRVRGQLALLHGCVYGTIFLFLGITAMFRIKVCVNRRLFLVWSVKFSPFFQNKPFYRHIVSLGAVKTMSFRIWVVKKKKIHALHSKQENFMLYILNLQKIHVLHSKTHKNSILHSKQQQKSCFMQTASKNAKKLVKHPKIVKKNSPLIS